MAALASATKRIQIGSLVACTGFRNPGLVAKMTETIDDISGVVILGLGAGWHEPEYDAFGYPFDHRVSRFEEAMAIIQPLLAWEHVDFEGKFFQARDAVNRPRGPRARGRPSWSAPLAAACCVSSPATPMLGTLSGTATPTRSCPRWPRLTRLAAMPVVTRRRWSARKRRQYRHAGIPRKRPDPIRGTDEEIASTILRFRELGIQHFVAGLDPCTPETIAQFARVIELVDTAS